jgi:hypothetical protein
LERKDRKDLLEPMVFKEQPEQTAFKDIKDQVKGEHRGHKEAMLFHLVVLESSTGLLVLQHSSSMTVFSLMAFRWD